jgi:DNA-binding transcriptional LysR family regulator
MDRLDSLNAFVQAAEARNFTVAGRKLGISASAVGKTIVRLEQRLGVRLFNRSTRSVALTTEGEAFLRRCQRIFQEVEAAELEIAASAGVPRGKLKIGLPLVGNLLTTALSQFAKAYPEIELEIDFADRMVDVIEEGFDVVLRTGPAVDSQLITKTLGTYSYVIVGSPAYLATHGAPHAPEDLAGHVCLRHRWSTTGKLESWRLTRGDGYLDVDIPASIVANNLWPLIEMAERDVVCVPTFAVRRQRAAGALASVLDDYIQDVGVFRMLWPPSRNLTPKHRVFVDFMSDYLFADLSHGPDALPTSLSSSPSQPRVSP